MQTFDMVFICKKCKKAFRKDAREMEDAYVYAWRVGRSVVVHNWLMEG